MKHLNKYYAFKEKISSLKNTNFKILGNIKSKNLNYPLFRIDINSHIVSPSICFSAAIHGNETSGVTGILKWLKINNISNEINYRLYPIVNPHGYNLFRRTNHNRVNLNREFKKSNPQREIHLIKNDLKNKFFNVFISFHENSAKENEDFYIFSYPNKESIKLSRFFINKISKHVTIDKRNEIDGHKANNGLIIDNMQESFEFYIGENNSKASLCVEIPSKISIKHRTEVVKDIISLTERYVK